MSTKAPLITLSVMLILSIALFSPATAQQHWTPLPKPTMQNLNKLSFLDSLRGWVVGDSGTILKTTSGGRTWISQNSDTQKQIIDVFLLDERFGWALAHDFEPPGRTLLLSTTDGGNLWRTRVYETAEVFLSAVRFLDRAHGWMGGYRGELVGTTDGGASWFDANVDSSIFIRYPIWNMRFFSPHYGDAVGGVLDLAGVVWKTTNAGQRWTTLRVAPAPIYDLCFLDSLNVVLIGGEYDLGAGIARTTNAGMDWEYRNLMDFGEGRTIAFRTNSEGWASLGFAGQYMSTFDSGENWRTAFTPDTSMIFDMTFTDPAHGFMVGQRGTILKYTTPPVGVTQDHSQPPPFFSLHQNFPNPFNPSTEITFSVGATAYTKLLVFNTLGQEVATLFDDVAEHGRDYRVHLDGTRLSSGVYFYRIHSGSKLASRKLMVVK